MYTNEVTDSVQNDFVTQLLTWIAEEDLHGSIFWRTDEASKNITFFVNTNDILAWGCADAEEINEQTFPVLQQAVADCKAIDPICGANIGCDLFACRMNKMRPQGAVYLTNLANRKFWPLFDACGPERIVGYGNPFGQNNVDSAAKSV